MPTIRFPAHDVNHLERTLRLAARDLCPVVVRGGGWQLPRLKSFCDAIVEAPRGLALRLHPIACELLPCGSVRIVQAAAEEPWMLSAGAIVREGSDAALVDIASARLAPLTERRAARAKTSELAAIVSVGTEGLGIHAFPVVDISEEWCAMDAPHALPPGCELESIEIVRGQRVLRRCGGTVVASIPWCSPVGERTFRWRVALRPMTVRGRRHEVVSEPAKLLGVLHYAVALGLAIICKTPRMTATARLTTVEAAEMRVDLGASADAVPRVGSSLSLAFDLFTDRFEADVRVLEAGATVTTTLPLVLRRRRERHQQRSNVAPLGSVKLHFQSPITGSICERDVREVSFGGLSFTPDPADVLWADLPLEQATLVWNERHIALDEARVRSVKHSCARVQIARHSASGDIDMVDMVAAFRHPGLTPDGGERFDEMLELQRSVRALTPYAARTLAEAPEASSVWHRMHVHAPDVCRTLARTEHGRIVAMVTAVRAWEHTWFPGSMAALPDRVWREPAGLDLAYTDHIVLRPDAHYSLMAVKVGNERQTSFLGDFLLQTGTPEVGLRRTVHMWGLQRGTVQAPAQHPGVAVRAMSVGDEPLVARAAARVYSEIHAAALSMVPGEFSLPDTARRFARAGIDRSRDCSVVVIDDVPVLAILADKAPPGFHINYILSAVWLLPIHPDLFDASVWGASLAHVVRERPPTAESDCLVFVPEGTPTEPLCEAGFAYQFSLDVYAYNRAGTQRWYDYVHQVRGHWAAAKETNIDGVTRLRRGGVS